MQFVETLDERPKLSKKIRNSEIFLEAINIKRASIKVSENREHKYRDSEIIRSFILETLLTLA